MTATETTPIKRYDEVLGPVAARFCDDTPHRLVLAVACQAHEQKLSVATTRAWLRSRCPGPVADLASDRAAFGSRWGSAYKRTRRYRTPADRQDLRVRQARRLIGHLLAPWPAHLSITAGRGARARAAFAAVGLALLDEATRSDRDQGRDKIVMPAAQLALALGTTEATARGLLATLVEARWLRAMPTKRGCPVAYKFAELTGEKRDAVWTWSDVVDALGDGAENPAADVIRLVAHPALGWGTAPLGHTAWLAGLLLEAQVEPGEVSLTARNTVGPRRAWLTAFAADGVAGLDGHATATGAVEARAEAAEKRAAKVADRAASAELDRRRKAAARTKVKALLADQPLPKPSAPAADRRAWLDAMTAAVAARSRGEVVELTYLAKTLARAMVNRGYAATAAAKVAARVFGLPPPSEVSETAPTVDA